MEEKLSKTKEKAKEILGKYSINVLSNEKEVIEALNNISETDGENLEYDIKTIDNIERYIKTKEKMLIAEKDISFLKKLSKKLKEQEIRMTDTSRPPLFKINNSLGDDVYFLTREALKEYCEVNEKNSKKIVEISKSNSVELAELLEVIKRNF